jgi:cell wall-associated NlpC family hydrolase
LRCFVLAAAVTLAVLVSPVHAYAEPSTDDLDRQVTTDWEHLEAVVERYNAAREGLAATEAKASRLRTELAPLHAQAEALQNEVSRYAAGLYKNGDADLLAALIAAPARRALVEQLSVVDYLSRQRQQALDALARTQREYAAQLDELARLSARQAAMSQQLAAEKTGIEADIAKLQQRRTQVYGARAGRSAIRDGYVPIFTRDIGGQALRFAFAQLGKAYAWAAEGPGSYDCSGLTKAAWGSVGVQLPHNAAAQWRTVRHVTQAELRPGDLVFYYRDIHHVALYAGEGHIIHAPEVGDVVSVRPMDFAPIFGFGRP